MRFGAHVRQSGGLIKAIERGEAAGCEIIQVFTQSPRQWRASGGPETWAAAAERRRASTVVTDWVCHATYLINLASPNPDVAERSARCLVENLRAATALGASALILHAGSHLGAGFEARLPFVALAIESALAQTEGGTDLLLENTAGAGGTIGRTFDELARIIEAVGGDERLGVCLDSQHLWASGTSFATPRAMDDVVHALDRAVGLDRLRCLHLNDSKVPLGAQRDRHENLGQGTIGARGLASFLGHPALQGLPAIAGDRGHRRGGGRCAGPGRGPRPACPGIETV